MMGIRVAALALLVVLVSCQRGGRGQQQQQGKNIDPYQTLQIAKGATPKEIKQAYRKLSLQYHPDKNRSPDAKEKMNEVSEAYEMVGDPDKKLIFDEFGSGETFTNRWQYEQTQRMKGKQVSTKGFYTGSEDITTLTMRNFYQTIRKGKGAVLATFYAPWCVHCQQMVSEYKKAAILLEGIAEVGAVNCEAEKGLCRQQGIRGYPTLRVFLPSLTGQQETEDFQGNHQAEDMYSFVQMALSDDVISLVDADFDTETDNGDLWVVDFSAGAWCGPCAQLKPVLKRAANSLLGLGTKTALVNCDVEKNLCARLGVQYYPQLRLFLKGKTGAAGETLGSNEQNPAAAALSLLETVLKLVSPPKEPAPEAEAGAGDHGAAIDEDEDARMDREHAELHGEL